VPYVWSDQYDRKFQFLGRAAPGDEMTIVDGSAEARQLTALFRRGERVSACLTINQPRAIVKYRKLLAQNVSWQDVLQDLRRDNARQ
jgi:hypothetical protein